MRTGVAKEIFSKFGTSKIAIEESPLRWPKRLRSDPLFGTRGFRLLVACEKLSDWTKKEGCDSPLANLYLELAAVASVLLLPLKSDNNKFDDLSAQLTKHKRWLWSCNDSLIVGLSADEQLRVVGKTAAEVEKGELNGTDGSKMDPINTKTPSKRQRESAFSGVEVEELARRLEVADLILQWLVEGRKPKMSSPDFGRWLKKQGYRGECDVFKAAYVRERKWKSMLGIVKSGRGETLTDKAIDRQKKWIAVLKAEHKTRL